MTKIKRDYEELKIISETILKKANINNDISEIVTKILLTANLQGIHSHGIRRLLPYVKKISQGGINPNPNITIKKIKDLCAIINGANGLGPYVAWKSLEKAIEFAKDNGIAYVGAYKSNHFGAGAPYAMYSCEENIICLLGSNAYPSMASWGGIKAVLGTNPFCVAFPRNKNPDFILDIAISKAARGKIREAKDNNKKIPKDWALNKYGKSTQDPKEALEGTVLPIGEHKGFGLAMMIEILSGVLTGSAFSTNINSLYHDPDLPQDIGHFFIAINPELLGMNTYYKRIEDLCNKIKSSKQDNELKEVFIPGEIEAMNYKKNIKGGVPIEKKFMIN